MCTLYVYVTMCTCTVHANLNKLYFTVFVQETLLSICRLVHMYQRVMWVQERSQSGWVLGTGEVTEWVGTGNRRGHRVGGYWEQERSQSGWVLGTGEVTEWVDTGNRRGHRVGG